MRKRSIEKKCAAILFAASLSLGVAACGTTDWAVMAALRAEPKLHRAVNGI